MFSMPSLRPQLESNFSVAGPASLSCQDDSAHPDPASLARAMYQHYLGDVQFGMEQSEYIKEV